MRARAAFLIIFSLLALNVFAWGIVYNINQPRDFEVIFFDIGQGDAALIKTGLGHYILIDGGPDDVILDKLSQEIPFWEKRIDLIILTHSHADHLSGLIHVLREYDVKNILWTGAKDDTAIFKEWEKEIGGGDYGVHIAHLGKRIRSGEFFMDILYPFEIIEGRSFDDANLSSIILKTSYSGGHILFMGDAYKSNEKELIEMEDYCRESEERFCRAMILDSDAIKIGHHGSRTSTSEEFIKRVLPNLAVISAGRGNRYGHPHNETLEVLENYGIRILRTDRDGDVRVVLNGEN